MPTSPTYPGVYIQELPSGNRTIVGVGTSITAFVGRTRRGPTDEPVRVASFGEFARIFGGLWSRSPMSYAVYQYFLSGGTTALIVRVTDNTATEAGSSSGTSIAAGTELELEDVFFLRAKNISEDNDHGDDYRVTISHPDAADNGVHRFVLQLADNPAGTDPESYNVTMIEGDDAAWTYIGDLATRLQEESNIAELLAIPTRRPPLCTLDAFTGGSALPETAATWSVEHVSGLVLQAPTGTGPFTATLTHDSANASRFTLEVFEAGASLGSTVLTIDPSSTVGATLAVPGVALDDDTDAAPLGTILAASRDRPEPVSEAPYSTGSTPTISLPGIRGVRFQSTETSSPFGDNLLLDIDPDSAHPHRFTLTASYSGGGGPTPAAYTVTMNAEEADGTSIIYVGSLPSGWVAQATSYSGHRPDDSGGAQLLWNGVDTLTAPATRAFTSTYTAYTLRLSAASEGAWANSLRVTIDHNTADDTDASLFNLTVDELDADGAVVATEQFLNVSLLSEHRRFLGAVLEEESDLVELAAVTEPYEHTRPAAVVARLTDGADGGAVSEGQLIGSSASLTGMHALERADLFNLLCLPPPEFDVDVSAASWALALAFCAEHRAMCIVDAKESWTADTVEGQMNALGLPSENGAIYFPRVRIGDPLRENRLRNFAPCGVVAGVIAKTDAQRGVWKAPAGLEARAPIVRGINLKLTDADSGALNPLGLNVIRTLPGVGTVIWGSRTLVGSDRLASDWKYLPVRRLALYIEESLYRGLQWAVFEPNDEPLWGQIRLSAGGFMNQLFRQGAFKGSVAKDAYFVKCDSETTTDADVDRGVVNVTVGFAPLKPAEFVILSIQQIAGQVSA